jgi:DNA-binding NarL/FixJ family response regulator
MKIVIADSHRLVREGMACLLRNMELGTIVEVACSGAEAIHQYAVHKPDVLITELLLPDYSGLELCRRIKQRWRKGNVVFLSGTTDISMVKQALSVGAHGFISKGCSPAELLAAIKATVLGDVYLEHSLAMQLAMGQMEVADNRLAEMTPREVEILILIARGASHHNIAQRLSISAKTVANHLSALKNKLEISSSLELLHFAVDLGLVHYGAGGSGVTASVVN